MDTINIASSFDLNYAKYFINTIGSLLRNHPNRNIHCYLILDRPQTLDYVHQRCSKLFASDARRFDVRGAVMADDDVEFFSRNDRRDSELRQDIKPVHYSQLLFPRYFELEKYLYLEPDQIAVNDLSVYYEQDISREVLGAVPSPIDYADELVFATLEKTYLYFNAGVTLVDARSWRQSRIEAKARDLLVENAKAPQPLYKFYTQGILNLIFHETYKPFNYALNLTYYPSYYHNTFFDPDCGFFQSANLAETCENASILHYNGGRVRRDCPMIEHYLSYDCNRVL